MNFVFVVLALLIGIVIGGGGLYWALRSRIGIYEQRQLSAEADSKRLQGELQTAVTQRATFEERAARIEGLESELGLKGDQIQALISEMNAERTLRAKQVTQAEADKHHLEAEIALLLDMKTKLETTFNTLSSEALRKNNATFLEYAQEVFGKEQLKAKGELDKKEQTIDTMVKPIKELMEKSSESLRLMEEERKSSFALLAQNLASLNKETSKLSTSMKDHTQRGKWGELSLERAFEIAGLVEGRDFEKQQVFKTDDGRQIPDYIVRLRGDLHMVVDVKTPYDRYDEAVNLEDPGARSTMFLEHARLVRSHINALSKKDYSRHLPGASPFVVMFLPLESMLSEALKSDPSLIDHGMKARIAIATPTTIIAMLTTIAYAWTQEQFAQNAVKIQDESRKLFDALVGLMTRIDKVSDRINSLVQAQNDVTRFADNTVHRAATRIKELKGGSDKEVPELEPITNQAAFSNRSPVSTALVTPSLDLDDSVEDSV